MGKEKKEESVQTGCTAPEQNKLLRAKQNIRVQLKMNSPSFFIKPAFSFSKPTKQPDNLIWVTVNDVFSCSMFSVPPLNQSDDTSQL